MAESKIEVKRLFPVNGSGNLRALASVRLGGITIDGFRVVQQPGQKPWVSVPQEKDREGKWRNRVWFESDKLKEAVQAAVLEAYRRQCNADALEGEYRV